MTKQGFEPKVRWEHVSLSLKETESREENFWLKQSPEFSDKAGFLCQYAIRNHGPFCCTIAMKVYISQRFIFLR